MNQELLWEDVKTVEIHIMSNQELVYGFDPKVITENEIEQAIGIITSIGYILPEENK